MGIRRLQVHPHQLRDYLNAPTAYWLADPRDLTCCNGCGTGSWAGKLDRVLGVDLSPACNIHDYLYQQGGTGRERLLADIVFIGNVITLLLLHTSLHNLWRVPVALLWYPAVRLGGVLPIGRSGATPFCFVKGFDKHTGRRA